MVTYAKTGGVVSVPLGTTGGAVADLPNNGMSIVTGEETYALAAPALGVRKTLVATSTTTTAGPTVRFSTATTVTDGGANTQIAFGAATTYNQVVEMIGVNTTEWAIVSIYPPASTGAGPVAGTT